MSLCVPAQIFPLQFVSLCPVPLHISLYVFLSLDMSQIHIPLCLVSLGSITPLCRNTYLS